MRQLPSSASTSSSSGLRIEVKGRCKAGFAVRAYIPGLTDLPLVGKLLFGQDPLFYVSILLTKLDGEPHAITDVCPHNGSSLSEGVIRDGCVTCPAHLWRFSLHDGEKQGTPEVRLRVYPTRLTADGWVEVEVPAAPPVRSLRETLLAHARGEDVSAVDALG